MADKEDKEYLNELAVLVEKARDSFLAFVLLMHPPGASSIVLGKLHKYLIAQVQNELTGKATGRLAVSVPPQHGKSTFLSILAAAWHLGKFPGKTVAISGAIGSLIHDFSKKIRAIVSDEKYAMVFPKAKIVYGSNRAEHWKLTNLSELVAKAQGAKLTGRRVDWLIIDDPHKGREEAESDLQRQRVKEWYFADCYTRLSPTAKVFLIGTRFHPEDLIGNLTSEEYAEEMRTLGQGQEVFTKVVIEAMCEHPNRDPLGREYGEALAPELGRTKEFLNGIKAAIPAYEWDSQYQGSPRAKSSGQVETDKITLVDWTQVPRDATFARGWDFALTEKQSSDFSAGALGCYHKPTGNFYICDMSRKQLIWNKLKKHVISLGMQDRYSEWYTAMLMGIESVGGYEVAYRELKESTLLGSVSIKPVTSNKSKAVRAQGWFNLIEASKVFMVRGPWNKEFISELSQFPGGQNDDQVDAVTVLAEVLQVAGKKKRCLIA